ncbi:MAG: phosphoglycolate phosphatase [Alphaproteobacteria bacterium]|nr:MAG: phosphoglycolate phosphatase [Alphaproteobacteria bacterium]
MRETALLFDLDGTLVDTAPDLHGALNHSLARAGRRPVSLEDVQHMVGRGARVLLQLGLKATGGMPSDEVFEGLVTEFFDYYEDHLSDMSRPYDGVIETLDAFRAAGAPMAVCTNKPRGFAFDLLEELNMGHYFSAITGGDSFHVRKPDAGHITGTLKAMGKEKSPAIMIGDSVNDIEAARAANIPSIAVSYGYTETPVKLLAPDHIVDHFRELVPLIQRLTAKTA